MDLCPFPHIFLQSDNGGRWRSVKICQVKEVKGSRVVFRAVLIQSRPAVTNCRVSTGWELVTNTNSGALTSDLVNENFKVEPRNLFNKLSR